MAKKRGSETIADMVRSMGLLLVVVVVAYLLARPPSSDTKEVRVVRTGAAVQAALETFGEPVLVARDLPAGWRPTSAYARPDDATQVTRLHIGWLTPADDYAELEQVTADRSKFLDDLVDSTQPTGTVTIAGEPWTVYRHGSDNTLSRESGGVLVVVNGSADDTELRELAGSLDQARPNIG